MVIISARSVKPSLGFGKTVGAANDKEETDKFEMSKENLLNCSPYSLFESHKRSGSAEGVPSKSAGEGRLSRHALHPRKRSLSESRLSAPPSATRGRELSPPELTTSDNFKPAKRILGPKAPVQGKKLLSPVQVGLSPALALPSPAKTVPRSGATETRNPDTKSSRAGGIASTSSLAKRTTLRVRMSSIVSMSSKDNAFPQNVNETVKEKEKEPMKKVMVFSAKKVEQQPTSRVKKDVVKARTGLPEKKSVSTRSPIPSGKPPSVSGKAETHVKDESAAKCRVVASQFSNSKAAAETIRTRKLSSVLQNEQRLQEENKQLDKQLRQLKQELVEKDDELEKVRSACTMLNNLANSQSDEVRELKFSLKETFNENAQLRVKLEKERHVSNKSCRMMRDEIYNKSMGAQLAVLTQQLQNMGVSAEQSAGNLACNQGRGDISDQPGAAMGDEGFTNEEPTYEVHSEAQEDLNRSDADDFELANPMESVKNHLWSAAVEEVTEEGPVISNHQDVHCALQDLQDIISQEETSLKDRCADALKQLNLPLTPLLSSQGVLDVDSLNALIASVSSRGDEFSSNRFNSIFRF